MIAESAFSSTSILRWNGDAPKGVSFTRKVNKYLDMSIAEEAWINKILTYINTMVASKEKHIIISNYIEGISDRDIMNELNIKQAAFYALKNDAIRHLGAIIPTTVYEY